MKVHEFGSVDQPTVVLIHPSGVMWDFFEFVIPLLASQYHLVIPALPGYDEEQASDFTSVEQIADNLEAWLLAHTNGEARCVYGCSMGGSVVIRMLANRRVIFGSAVLDGAITPYQLPWMMTRCIAVRDFVMVTLGKWGGLKLLERAFATDEYTAEDLQYVAKVLKMMSYKTIWRTFESCNNYTMPAEIKSDCSRLEYWYTAKEQRARRGDIAYVKKHFPQTIFRCFHGIGHGGLAPLYPQRLADELKRTCAEEKS